MSVESVVETIFKDDASVTSETVDEGQSEWASGLFTGPMDTGESALKEDVIKRRVDDTDGMALISLSSSS